MEWVKYEIKLHCRTAQNMDGKWRNKMVAMNNPNFDYLLDPVVQRLIRTNPGVKILIQGFCVSPFKSCSGIIFPILFTHSIKIIDKLSKTEFSF